MTDRKSAQATPHDNARELEADQRWRIGSDERGLNEQQQLEELRAFIDAHYQLPDFTPPWKGGVGDPAPADNYTARLPDRITHAAQLILGSAVDHSMPGVAFTDGIEVEDVADGGAIFHPSEPTGRWAVSLHSGGWWRGAGQSMQMQWRPEVAAAAQLSGTTILDLDYPLAPQHTVADMVAAVRGGIDSARSRGATSVAVWGYSSGGALAALAAADADALVLTYPDFAALDGLPEDIRAGYELPNTWPRTLLQVATADEIATRPELADAPSPGVTTTEYVSGHRVSTPAVARQRIKDTADFLRNF